MEKGLLLKNIKSILKILKKNNIEITESLLLLQFHSSLSNISANEIFLGVLLQATAGLFSCGIILEPFSKHNLKPNFYIEAFQKLIV